MNNARRALLTAGSVVLVVAPLAAACAGSSPSTPSPPASTSPAASKAPSKPVSGRINLTFTDSAAQVACPSTAPPAAECFSLIGSGTDPAFGVVKIGPLLDPEVSMSSPLCGQTAQYTTVLTGAGGTMTVAESGPRLCLGSTTSEPRHFSVVSGTGAYTGATGSGAISLMPQSVGAVEAWTGVITLATQWRRDLEYPAAGCGADEPGAASAGPRRHGRRLCRRRRDTRR